MVGSPLLPSLLPHALRMDRTAIEVPGGETLSYGELVDRVESAVRDLAATGVSGARVALVMRNDVDALVLALALAGVARCVPLNPAYTEAELGRYLAASRAEALVATSATPAAIAAARTAGLTLLGDGGALTNGSAGARLPEAGFLFQTSGTTATPRGVPLTNDNVAAGARNVVEALELTEDDATWLAMPLFHVHGLIGAALGALASGGRLVLPPAFHAAALLDALDAERLSWYTASPARHHALVAYAETTSRSPRRHPRFVRTASAPMTSALRERLHELLIAPVINAYGMTEAAHQIASSSLRTPMSRSVGRPIGCDVRIHAEDGSFALQGEVGEVIVRGASVMAGYDDSAASSGDGWLHTGDLGFFCGKGNLHLVARTTEVINRGGEKIAPTEIDDVLSGHPAVLEAAAYAVPSERLGQAVAAAVVLRGDASVSSEDLQRYAAERLATFKVPTELHIVDALPRGGTGKVLRGALAELFPPTRAGAPTTDAPAVAPLSVEEIVAAIWRDILDVQEVTETSDFFELGGDSLSAQDAVLEVAERFGTEPSMSEFFAEPTVRGVAARVRAQRGSDPALHGPVIKLRPGTGTGTLVVVQGAGFSVDHYRPLIRHIASDLPVVGLQEDVLAYERLTRNESRDLAEFARALADALRELAAPPYYLIGYSSAGLIAVEVARALGASAARVILLDTVPPHRRGVRAWVRRGFNLLFAPSIPELHEYARWTASGAAGRIARARSRYRAGKAGSESANGAAVGLSAFVRRSRPPKVDVPITLIASRVSQRRSIDLDLGWRDVGNMFELFAVEGDHSSPLSPAMTPAVAAVIDRAVKVADPAGASAAQSR